MASLRRFSRCSGSAQIVGQTLDAVHRSPGKEVRRCVGTLVAPQHTCARINDFNATGTRSQHQRDQHLSHHRHRGPPPNHTFTPYSPIHLSRPPARQPSHTGLSIPQLLPPRRRHTCTGAALRRKRRCRPDLRPVLLSSHHARFQSEPPWGQEPLHRIINGLAPPVKRYVRKYSSALASGSE
jgi:hypothetical protein